MRTVILCGGQGTRIRDVADHLPKPMIPVGRHPVLWHIMKTYAHSGFRDFVLCLGFRGDVIKQYFLSNGILSNDFTLTLGPKGAIEWHGDSGMSDWRITFADTGLDAMTGARLRRIRHYLGDDDFMLTYGDGVSDVDIDALLAFHRSHGRIMTVTGVLPPGRFGELTAGPDGLVRAFNEKPQAAAGLISGGYFVCRQEIFDYLDDREDLVLEAGPMQQLAHDGQMMTYRHSGFWQCMDTPRDWRLLNELWSADRAPWKVW